MKEGFGGGGGGEARLGRWWYSEYFYFVRKDASVMCDNATSTAVSIKRWCGAFIYGSDIWFNLVVLLFSLSLLLLLAAVCLLEMRPFR